MKSHTLKVNLTRAALAAVLAGLVMLFAGCAAVPQEGLAPYVDDSTITAAIKAKFVQDHTIDSGHIDVETFKGTVVLSGFTRSGGQRAQAEYIAASTRGVVEVRNNLQPLPEHSGEIYPVWYGTNRTPIFKANAITGYSETYEAKINYGSVLVEIPEDFLKASGTLALARSVESKLLVRPPVPLDPIAFYRELREQLAHTKEKDALIYLHGFQTTFVEAAQRAASIGYHLKMPLTVFYSWPSLGNVGAYGTDLVSVERSENLIAKFLIDTVKNSGAKRVHVIAHSMGNQGLMRAMFTPLMNEAMKANIHFGQIILAAPDIDKDTFNERGSLFGKIADRVTLYASSNDRALNMSKKLRPTLDRAGLMPPPAHAEGVEVVDVGAVNLTLLGHAYVSEEIRVLHDMFSLIKYNKAADERAGVVPYSRDRNKNTHWILY
jgi:esterase/lipase superfamily enzyme